MERDVAINLNVISFPNTPRGVPDFDGENRKTAGTRRVVGENLRPRVLRGTDRQMAFRVRLRTLIVYDVMDLEKINLESRSSTEYGVDGRNP